MARWKSSFMSVAELAHTGNILGRSSPRVDPSDPRRDSDSPPASIHPIRPAHPPARPMELVQAAAEDCAAANGGADVHHEVPAVLHAGPLAWWLRLGYFFVAAPVTAACAGLLDGPWAAASAYAVLLLGVASTWRAALPPRPLERVRANESRAEVTDGRGNQHEVATFPKAVMAWCGYLLVAVAATGSSYGLAGTPVAALVAYALLLLGVASIWRAMLPPRPMERAREDNPGVGKRNRQGHEVAVSGAWTMAWCGCLLVAVPVLASWAGFIDGLGTTFFACTLQLLGVAIIIAAMLLLALAKLKIA